MSKVWPFKRVIHYNAINFERKLLSIFGFYSGQGFETQTLNKLIFKISMFLSVSLIFTMGAKIFLEQQDLAVLFEIFHVLITQIAFVLKATLFWRGLPKLYALEELLRGPIFNQHTEEQDRYISRAIFTYKIFARSFQFSSWGAMVMYSICPIIDGSILALPIWFPFEDGKYRIYAQIYEIFCFIILSTIDAAIDCLSACMLNLMAIQLDILNDNLTHIGIKMTNGNCLNPEQETQNDLKKYIGHYTAIIRFVSKLEEIFAVGIFAQIFTSIVAICTSGLEMILANGTFVSTLLYFSTMVIEIGMFCWFSQDIITKSSQIGTSCYMSEWYNCSTSTKKIIFIIMERAKKQVKFRAGYIFEISLATFVMILRNSYSYFAVLMQVYKR